MDGGNMELALKVLAGLGIQEVELSLNGGGDSGDCEIERVLYRDGREVANLPAIAIGFDNRAVFELHDLVVDLAAEVPDGDWVNNEGGQGSVTLLPLETDEDARVSCMMEYGGEEDDEAEGFEDEDADVASLTYREAELAEHAVHPTIVVASRLQDEIGAVA